MDFSNEQKHNSNKKIYRESKETSGFRRRLSVALFNVNRATAK